MIKQTLCLISELILACRNLWFGNKWFQSPLKENICQWRRLATFECVQYYLCHCRIAKIGNWNGALRIIFKIRKLIATNMSESAWKVWGKKSRSKRKFLSFKMKENKVIEHFWPHFFFFFDLFVHIGSGPKIAYLFRIRFQK